MALDINKKIMENYENLKIQLRKLHKDLDNEKIVYTQTKAEGDLSENAGFVTSKDKIARLEKRIADVKHRITTFEEHPLNNPNLDMISIGSVFTLAVINKRGLSEKEYTIKLVPAALGMAKIGALSVESPVGKACEGNSVNSTFTVNTPAKIRKFKVVEIIKEVT